jgi:hypothetical protein
MRKRVVYMFALALLLGVILLTSGCCCCCGSGGGRRLYRYPMGMDVSRTLETPPIVAAGSLDDVGDLQVDVATCASLALRTEG